MDANILKHTFLISFFLLIVSTSIGKPILSKFDVADTSFYPVPLAGNAFLTIKPTGATEQIRNSGLIGWSNAASVVSVYFRVNERAEIRLKLRARVASDANSSKITVTVAGVAKEIDLSGTEFQDYEVGTFSVPEGYVKVDLQGKARSGNYFAEVSHLVVDGSFPKAQIIYSNDPSFYYWARRGPSCHMAYVVPTTDPVQYYYGELTVPEGEDAVGSYFMSHGFSEGYFGIQVNSDRERRILFSVWSPYATDNPADIPKHLRVTLNKKGTDVHTGEFGNEGSGGQSYFRYSWTAGTTYRFLLKAQPDLNGATDYSAWIYLDDSGGWFLIASWKRPDTDKYLTGFHSFLENFDPNQGHIGRKVLLSNRWVRTVSGQWLAVNTARFTVDATYNASQRIDAIGGTLDHAFFLQNGGFFSRVVTPGSTFSMTAPAAAPCIDFDNLP
ncbi:DUF3472 domain-containing protein [Sphingobacterium griseoflavum]|uniref:DUF5077 domain-containing protein n=1 Tax=Sphingobacterium griseoflavum TaxID=1474952 RepID=A0ABQ3HXE0_9SPHI|nr:DUF3472 domain-containing protein [Sphingobacterium griseoflavum]GHE43240.1 hypothetical protein GCM10017764_28070 [Sphingobacterium griseoflavum]